MSLSVTVGIRVRLTRDEDAEPMERQELTDLLVDELQSVVEGMDFESYTVDNVIVAQIHSAPKVRL